MNRDNARLYSADVDAAGRTYLGDMGRYEPTDIAYDGTNIFAITFDYLYLIDPSDASSTFVASHGQTGMNALVYNYDDGLLYGASTSGEFGSLTTDGTYTQIGYFGGGITSSGDLAFAEDGTLYATVNYRSGVDHLATINPTTGAATIVGSLGRDNVYGLFYENGQLYGFTEAGVLLSINPSTAANTAIRDYGSGNHWGAAGDDHPPVPEPSTMLLLAAGLVGLAGFRMKFSK
ncbi:DUF6923 family protein [Thermodesulfobacteriota bacterium]